MGNGIGGTSDRRDGIGGGDGQRRLPDWITSYLEYTTNTESPRIYHQWVAISTLAAACRRRIWVEYGRSNLYLNLFVVLVGPPGTRKTSAIRCGEGILSTVAGVRLSSESLTRERLIAEMSTAGESFDYKGMTTYHSSVTSLLSELAVYLGSENRTFLSFLCDIFDGKEGNWVHATIGRGENKVQRPWLNVLGAITPEAFGDSVPQELVGSGFTSRLIMVVAYTRDKAVPFSFKSRRELELEALLVHDINLIAIQSGCIPYDPAAYDFWLKTYPRIDEATPLRTDPKFDGYRSRRGSTVMKLAALASISANRNLVTVLDIERAISWLDEIEPLMPDAFVGVGRSRASHSLNLIISIIRSAERISDGALLSRVFNDVEPQEYINCLGMLRRMKYIEHDQDQKTGVLYYVWIGGKGEIH